MERAFDRLETLNRKAIKRVRGVESPQTPHISLRMRPKLLKGL
jgi:hypothetical protein